MMRVIEFNSNLLLPYLIPTLLYFILNKTNQEMPLARNKLPRQIFLIIKFVSGYCVKGHINLSITRSQLRIASLTFETGLSINYQVTQPNVRISKDNNIITNIGIQCRKPSRRPNPCKWKN